MKEDTVIRVSIVGATGYSGAELAALIARHPKAEIVGLFFSGAGSAKRAPFESVHPSMAGKTGPDVLPYTLEAVRAAGTQVAFLATPNETSAELAKPLLDAGIKVIDLSGAFRLKDANAYPAWYGFTHPAPELLAEAVYGLTEWSNGSLSSARLVANPGCYPTSVLLALRPIASFLEREAAIVCDSKSGVSGAGKKSDVAFSFAELAGNFKAYGVGTHRHEPEMRQGLALPADAPFVFVPHLLPIVRGILSTIHVTVALPMEAEEIAAAYAEAYAKTPFVKVRPAGSFPELRDVVGTPRCEIGFALLCGGRQAVIVSAIDNLLKGAASQAVQNLNRISGFGDTEGLT